MSVGVNFSIRPLIKQTFFVYFGEMNQPCCRRTDKSPVHKLSVTYQKKQMIYRIYNFNITCTSVHIRYNLHFINFSSLPAAVSWTKYFSWLMYATETMTIVQWEAVTNISKQQTKIIKTLYSVEIPIFSLWLPDTRHTMRHHWIGSDGQIQFLEGQSKPWYIRHAASVSHISRTRIYMSVVANEEVEDWFCNPLVNSKYRFQKFTLVLIALRVLKAWPLCKNRILSA